MLNRSYINSHEGHPHYFLNSKLISLQKGVNFSSNEQERLRVVKKLSDPTRLKIYLLLHKVKEISVADIAFILNTSQSAISHALADLKSLGFVEAHRCGQLICYSLSKSKKQNKLFNFFNGLK